MTKPEGVHERTWPSIMALVATAVLWSLSGPVIKLLNSSGHGPSGLSISCLRSFFAGIMLAPFALKRLNTLRFVHPGWILASVAVFCIMTVTFVIATTMTAAASVILLQYTAPLWVFAFSPLILMEHPHKRDAMALVATLIGIGIMVSGGGRANLAALTVALVSGMGYGALTLILRAARGIDPIVIIWLNCLGSGVILLPFALHYTNIHLTEPQFALLVSAAFFQFSLPYLLFSWALRRVEAHKASLITLLEAALNPMWTYILVGEAVPRATVIGGPFIIVGVVGWLLASWRRERSVKECIGNETG